MIHMTSIPKKLCYILLMVTCTACPLDTKKKTNTGTATANKPAASDEEPQKGRLVMFIGMDISGSFMGRWHFDDSMRFLAHYIHAHLKGYGGLEIPSNLYVGSIGGAKMDEPKTFFPIQTFEHRSVAEIEAKLREIFPKKVQNPFTDYNAFFNQISVFVKNKKLILKPISIVMLSDGIPDAPRVNGKHDFRSLKLLPLENLARDITVRVLYTSAVTGMDWQTKVPRDRVKVWTQDADVMKTWKEKTIMRPGLAFPKQTRFFDWVKDNVDFKVPRKRVD